MAASTTSMLTLMIGCPPPAESKTVPVTRTPVASATVGSVLFPVIGTEAWVTARYRVPIGGPYLTS